MALWEVIGGADKGGIVVREGFELKSAQYDQRLATGAVVREMQLYGERLHYHLVTAGAGPQIGWVSLTLKGKHLLIPKQQDTVPKQQVAGKQPLVTKQEETVPKQQDTVVHPAATVPAEREFALYSPGEYYVLQSSLIKRLGPDPANPEKTMKISRKVGSKVSSNGRTWTGPQGGEWMELDSNVEKPGWLLVEGSGFGVAGPLLRMVEPGAETPILLQVPRYTELGDPDNVDMREFLIDPSAKVRDAKQWIAWIFGFEIDKIIMGAPLNISAEVKKRYDLRIDLHIDVGGEGVLLRDEVSIQEAGFTDGTEVMYVYLGALTNNGGK